MVVTDYNVAVEAVKWLLPALTVIAQAGLAAYFLLLIFYRKGYNYMHSKLSKWFLPMAFAVALAATSGSLFYSEIVGWTPCLLCWYQRIMMYPLVVILGIASLRRDKRVGVYVLPLAAIGGLIAAFHYAQQVSSTFAAISTGCAAAGGVECTVRYTFSYGYVTIPMMALTGFVTIGLLVLLKKRAK